LSNLPRLCTQVRSFKIFVWLAFISALRIHWMRQINFNRGGEILFENVTKFLQFLFECNERKFVRAVFQLHF
jgi:hypothetical protein